MRCAVFGCKVNNGSKDFSPEIKLFRFPKDKKTQDIWKHFCNRKQEFNLKTARICSKHFNEADYERNLRHELLGYTPKQYRPLKKGAIPTKQLPLSISTCPSSEKSESQTEIIIKTEIEECPKFEQIFLEWFPNPREFNEDQINNWKTACKKIKNIKDEDTVYKNNQLDRFTYETLNDDKLMANAVPSNDSSDIYVDHTYSIFHNEDVKPGTSQQDIASYVEINADLNTKIKIEDDEHETISAQTTNYNLSSPNPPDETTCSQTTSQKKSPHTRRTKVLRARLARQTAKTTELQEENKRLLSRIEELEKQKADEFKSAVDKHLPEFFEKMAKVLADLKIRRSWEFKQFALSLYYLSPSTYRTMASKFFLPSVRTLLRLKKIVQLRPGLNNIICKNLEHKLRNKNQKDNVL